MSEWRYIECDMCGAKSEPSVYPILHYRLEGWTHERDPDPDDYRVVNGDDDGIHGCDGCCAG